jgi:hypothetical protein
MSETLMYTFVLRLPDRPGALEVIAATFAQRGVSLCTSLGADSSLHGEGQGKVLVTFAATPAKKEVLRRALSRLSRVQSLVEYAPDSALPHKTALIRLAKGVPAPEFPANIAGVVHQVARDEATGEVTYLVAAPVVAVDLLLQELRTRDHLRDVTQCVLAL